MGALLSPLLLALLIAACSCALAEPTGYVSLAEQLPLPSWNSASIFSPEQSVAEVIRRLLTDKAMVASFTAQLGEPLFFRSCSRPSKDCRGPAILPCCSNCTEPQKDCYCPVAPDAICVDASSSTFYGIASGNGSTVIEIGLGPGAKCENWAVSMFVPYGLEHSINSKFIKRGNDHDQGAFLPFSSCNSPVPFARDARLEISTAAYQLPGAYPFVVSVLETSPSQPTLMLPTQFFYAIAPQQALLCEAGAVTANVTLSFPTADPALALWVEQMRLHVFEVDPHSLLNDALSFSLPLWTWFASTLTQLYDIDPTTCVLPVRNLLYANGSSVSTTINFVPQPPIACTANNLQRYLNAWERIPYAALYIDDIPAALSAINASVELQACAVYMRGQLLGMAQPSQQTEVAVSTTYCPYSPVDPRFVVDPCCNATLLLYMCCSERVLTASMPVHVANSEFVQSQCRTPACAADTLRSLLASDNSSIPILSQCESALFAAVRNFEVVSFTDFPECPYSQQEQYYLTSFPHTPWLRPCEKQSDCPLGASCEPQPFWVATTPQAGHVPLGQSQCSFIKSVLPVIKCEVSHMDPVLRGALAGAVGEAVSVSDEDLAKAVAVSPLFNDDLPFEYCTWNPGVGEPTCNQSWANDYYCAAGECSDDGGLTCFEVSRMPGCFAHYSFDGEELCANGSYLYYSTSTHFNCYFKQYPTIAECLPVDTCPPKRLYTDEYNRTFCDVLCTLPSLTTPAECECIKTPDNETCSRLGIRWNSTLGYCEVGWKYTVDSVDCESVGGSFFPGRVWQEPFLADKASCERAGLCTSDPENFWDTTGSQFASNVYTKAQCEARVGCDLPGYSTQAACERHGICSDSYLYGKCSLPPQFTPDGPSCYGDAFPMPSIPGTHCVGDTYLCTVSIPPEKWPDDVASCDVNETACVRPNTKLFSSELNAGTCTECGGKMRKLRTWQAAKWGPGKWYGFSWKRRVAKIYSRDSAIPLRVALSLLDAYARYIGSILLQYASCKTGQLTGALPSLVCDCLEQHDGCYDSPSITSVGFAFACANVATNFYNSEYPYFIWSISDSGKAIAGNTCGTVSFSAVKRETFALPTETPFSSFFLSAIHPNAYAVVRSNRSVAVGELRSDVIGLQINTASLGLLAINVAYLCIRDRDPGSHAPEFPVFAFAEWSPAAPTVFTPTIFQVAQDGQYWCANITQKGFYAVVKLAKSWRTASERDTLPHSMRVLFIVAAILYGVLLILCVARVVAAARSVTWSREVIVNFSAAVLLAIFLLFRTILFFMLYTGALRITQIVRLFVFAEFGTMLELTVGTLTAYIWIELYHRSRATGGTHDTSYLVPAIMIACGVLAYAFFIGVSIALPKVTAHAVAKLQALCARPSGPTPAEILDRVYKSGIAIFALALATVVALYGYLHVSRMRKMLDRLPFWQLVMVVLLTSIGLLLQAILVLYIAFRPGNWVVVIFGGAAELLRPAAMIFVLRSVSWQQVFCFWRKDSSEMTSTSTHDEGNAEYYVQMDGDDADF